MSVPAIDVQGVSRWFGRGKDRVVALRDVSFQIERASVVALLGANGAGKTTMAKVIATLLLPSVGTVRVLGHDVADQVKTCRKLTSVIFGGERGLYPQLSGLDNLRYFGMLAGVGRREARSRVPELLEEVGLAEAANRRVETYSSGMKQRLHIAIGFLPRPQVLLLDEPTVGLDPNEAERLRGAVRKARDSGMSILLTSHYLLDVERLADRVLLLDRGAISEDLPLAEFRRRAGYVAAITVRGEGPPPLLNVDRFPDGIRLLNQPTLTRTEWHAVLRVARWSPQVFGHLATLFADADVVDLQVQQVGLEEAFANATGEPA